MQETIAVGFDKLEALVRDIFVRAGVPARNARILAESLVQADLRGVDSHGAVRTGIYVQRLEAGMIDPLAEPAPVMDHGASALVDGRNNFGAVAGMRALEIAMEKARTHGASFVGVRHSNHFGTCAYYVLKAIRDNFALIVLSNASQTMPPTGGVRPFIGTNPLAMGVPSGRELPFVFDMATSVVARGKIIVAAQKGESIPLGWAIDKEGRPTTDAEKALDGSVLPIGGAKGYGISMMIDILSGVLTGAGFGKYVNNMYENWEEPQNVGHTFICVDIGRFMPIEQFKERMDRYIRDIKAEPRAEGVDEIWIPGEIEFRLTRERSAHGIPLSAKLVAELRVLAEKYGVDAEPLAGIGRNAG